MYDYEINHLPSSLRWWKCTSFQLLLYVIFTETETYWAGWFVANKRVLPCFLRASCLLCSFLGFSGGHGRERKQVSSSVGTVCTCHATRKMNFICCCWPLERTRVSVDSVDSSDVLWEIKDGPSCIFVSEHKNLQLAYGSCTPNWRLWPKDTILYITPLKKKKKHLTHRLSHLPCNGKSQHNTFTRYWKPRNGPRC